MDSSVLHEEKIDEAYILKEYSTASELSTFVGQITSLQEDELSYDEGDIILDDTHNEPGHYCIGLNTLLSDEDQLLLQSHSLFRSTLRSTSNSLYTSTKQYHKFTRNHNFTSENHSFKLSKEEYLSILETCEVHETSDVKPVVSVSTISAKFEIFKKCLLDTEYSTVSQCITHLPSHPTIGELSRFKKLNFEQHSTFKLVSLCLLRRYLCTFFLDYEECKMQKRIAETLCVNFQIPQGL